MAVRQGILRSIPLYMAQVSYPQNDISLFRDTPFAMWVIL